MKQILICLKKWLTIPPETVFFKTCFIVGLNLNTKNNKYRKFTKKYNNDYI